MFCYGGQHLIQRRGQATGHTAAITGKQRRDNRKMNDWKHRPVLVWFLSEIPHMAKETQSSFNRNTQYSGEFVVCHLQQSGDHWGVRWECSKVIWLYSSILSPQTTCTAVTTSFWRIALELWNQRTIFHWFVNLSDSYSSSFKAQKPHKQNELPRYLGPYSFLKKYFNMDSKRTTYTFFFLNVLQTGILHTDYMCICIKFICAWTRT